MIDACGCFPPTRVVLGLPFRADIFRAEIYRRTGHVGLIGAWELRFKGVQSILGLSDQMSFSFLEYAKHVQSRTLQRKRDIYEQNIEQ